MSFRSRTAKVLPDAQSARTVERRQHLGRVSRRSLARRERGERGYVLVMTSIVLPVLVLFIAMATDVTFLYARSVQLQRIADTAALAGVTRMPRAPEARAIAIDMAKRNGAVTATAGVTVTAEPAKSSNRRLTVTVRDAKIPLFFGRIFKDYWDVTKSATAEYVSNIPLGSKLNVIGNGNLDGAEAQNFWLAVSGPCQAKELGDQISTRYDGNSINATTTPGNNLASGVNYNRYARLCDWDPTAASTSDNTNASLATRTQVITDQKATVASTAGVDLFPELTKNLDYNPQGYNLIVDVPCKPLVAGGDPPPPPCDPSDLLESDLTIQVFDPVFDPDSLQRFLAPSVVGTIKPVKPDTYSVLKGAVTSHCDSTTAGSDGCLLFPGAVTAVNARAAQLGTEPAEVTVATDFRIYKPNSTPTEYTDDDPYLVDHPATTPNRLGLGAPFITSAEDGKVLRFGSCVAYSDAWMKPGKPLDSSWVITDTNNDYVPDSGGGDVTSYVPQNAADPSFESPANCQVNSAQWRTLAVIKAGTAPKGQFRVNVRTVSSPSSYGSNAFSLRAYSGAAYATCAVAGCPSVSGDNTMGVFASVPQVASFYLAKLSPPLLYRNKTVNLHLWDIGEGGNQIEVLQPLDDPTTCSSAPSGVYCPAGFDWQIDNPGFNDTSTGTADALGTGVVEYTDPCFKEGTTGAVFLSISGRWDTPTPSTSTCGGPTPAVIATREGFAPRKLVAASEGNPSSVSPCTRNNPDGSLSASGTLIQCPNGLFNDRSVLLRIKIPNDYGCKAGTGTSTVVCVETDVVPGDGWWKIRYTPNGKSWAAGTYQPLTDRTTWQVDLQGDPVRLVDP
jgi:Putative Flp pilus-assembly TadE/G-like